MQRQQDTIATPVFDNPLDTTRIPSEPTTFTMLACLSECMPQKRSIAVFYMWTALIGGLAAFIAFHQVVGCIAPNVAALIFVVGAPLTVTLAMTECKLLPISYKRNIESALCLTLLLCALLGTGCDQRLVWLSCGLLLFVNCIWFYEHWSQISNHGGIRYDGKSGSQARPSLRVLIAPALLAITIGHAPFFANSTYCVGALVFVFLVWTLLQGLKKKVHAWKILVYCVYHFLAYPHSTRRIPGLWRCPLPSEPMRLIPIFLFLTASAFAVALEALTTLPSSYHNPAFWTSLFQSTATFLALNFFIGLLALVSCWMYLSISIYNKIYDGVSPAQWQKFIDHLRESTNPLEQESIYLGTVAADGSPILVDRSLLREHVHFLGDTGGGKTSMGLNPLVEQLISFGDSTVIMLDLKGDKLETLASMEAARNHLKERTGKFLPLKHFTLKNNRATAVFNPVASVTWNRLTPIQRTDTLCGACGLHYGSDYGRAVFSAVNSCIVGWAERVSHDARKIATLFSDIDRFMTGKQSNELPADARRSGLHAFDVLGRLASIEALNLVTDSTNHETGKIESIDLEDCFKTPQLIYFQLPTTISAGASGAVARLAAYFLLAAAEAVEERKQVYLVIDEFQKMAAENLDSLFQLARSMNVSVVLANQSIEDLGSHGSGLMNVVETNCHIRQWFTISGRKDLQILETLSGTRNVIDTAKSVTSSQNGTTCSETSRTVKEPRINVGDALFVSDHSALSILRITGARSGYAAYRGLPFIARTNFHISRSEFERRGKFKWPSVGAGLIPSREVRPESVGATKVPKQLFTVPTQNELPSDGMEISEWNPDGFAS
jgi:hypothetical protein